MTLTKREIHALRMAEKYVLISGHQIDEELGKTLNVLGLRELVDGEVRFDVFPRGPSIMFKLTPAGRAALENNHA